MRYYFEIFDGDHWSRDDRGVEFPSDGRARHEAVLALTELARELLPYDGPSKDLLIRVRLKDQVAFTVKLEFGTSPGPALTDAAVAD